MPQTSDSITHDPVVLLGLATLITLVGALIRQIYALDKRTTLLEVAQLAEDKVLANMALKQDETLVAISFQKGADAERSRKPQG